MAIFNSYVKLPEGSLHQLWPGKSTRKVPWFSQHLRFSATDVPPLGTWPWYPRTWCWRTCYESGKTWRTLGSWADKNLVFCYWFQWLQLSPSIFFTRKPGEITCFLFHISIFSHLVFLYFINQVIRWGDLVNSWWKNRKRGYLSRDTLITFYPTSKIQWNTAKCSIHLGKFHHDRTLFSRTLEIMVYFRGIIPIHGRTIQVSEIL